MTLAGAVDALVGEMVGRSDVELERPYDWHGYDEEGVRFTLLVAHTHLRELAVELDGEAARTGAVKSDARRILAQLHLAYRDVTGILAGLRSEDLDNVPGHEQWTVREVLDHVLGTERGFLAVILLALDAVRTGREPEPVTREQRAARVPAITALGDAPAVRDALLRSHARILGELGEIGDEELETPAHFWEDEAFPVRFRLLRFEAHLRQHQVQLEKTLAAVGHPPTEAERLARLLHVALGEVELEPVKSPGAVAARDRAEQAIRHLAAEARALR